MSESLENENFGNGRGSSDRKAETEVEQEKMVSEIGPKTPVLHVTGSEQYHLYRNCSKLEHEQGWDESKSKHLKEPLGRLLGQMEKFNRRFQGSSMRLNETGELGLCTECDEKRKNPQSKNPDARM